MYSWYRNDRLRSVALVLAAGLAVGGIVTFILGLGSSSPRQQPDTTVAAAIAGDKAQPAAVPAELTTTPHRAKTTAQRPVRTSESSGAPAPAPTAEATPTPNSKAKAEKQTSAATPVASPRRQAGRRVVSERPTAISPKRRATPRSTPRSSTPAAPSTPAPAASTPPAPAPTATPSPTPTPRPTHGNGNGGGGNGNGGGGGGGGGGDDPGPGG
jgi:hypothetical protein